MRAYELLTDGEAKLFHGSLSVSGAPLFACHDTRCLHCLTFEIEQCSRKGVANAKAMEKAVKEKSVKIYPISYEWLMVHGSLLEADGA